MHQGYCGKGGQSVPVSDGAPHVLLSGAVVGGSVPD
jgi:TldD protein